MLFSLAVGATGDRQARSDRPRGDPINRSMYLIRAPFPAIVTCSLLFLIHETLATRAPIVVVISFSAGLMAESVLRTITGYADRSLNRLAQSSKNGRGKGREGGGQGEPGGSEWGATGKT